MAFRARGRQTREGLVKSAVFLSLTVKKIEKLLILPTPIFNRAPPWVAALTSRRGLIPSEPSASAERGTGRLSTAQLGSMLRVISLPCIPSACPSGLSPWSTCTPLLGSEAGREQERWREPRQVLDFYQYRTRLVLGFGGWLMGPHSGLSLRGCFVQTCPLWYWYWSLTVNISKTVADTAKAIIND